MHGCWKTAPLDETVVHADSICDPGTAGTEAEDRKSDEYRDLISDEIVLGPIVFEVQDAAGPSTEFFLNKLSKNLKQFTEEMSEGSFLNKKKTI